MRLTAGTRAVANAALASSSSAVTGGAGGTGGALHVQNSPLVAVEGGSSLQQNIAVTNGAAVYAANVTTIRFANASAAGNKAPFGLGGVVFADAATESVVVAGGSFRGNGAFGGPVVFLDGFGREAAASTAGGLPLPALQPLMCASCDVQNNTAAAWGSGALSATNIVACSVRLLRASISSGSRTNATFTLLDGAAASREEKAHMMHANQLSARSAPEMSALRHDTL